MITGWAPIWDALAVLASLPLVTWACLRAGRVRPCRACEGWGGSSGEPCDLCDGDRVETA